MNKKRVFTWSASTPWACVITEQLSNALLPEFSTRRAIDGGIVLGFYPRRIDAISAGHDAYSWARQAGRFLDTKAIYLAHKYPDNPFGKSRSTQIKKRHKK